MTRRWSFSVLIFGLAVAAGWPLRASAQPPSPMQAQQQARQQRQAAQRFFRIVDSEPSIEQVQNNTLEYYKLHPDRVNQIARHARYKGLLPELEVGYDRGTGTRFQNVRDGLYPILPQTDRNPNPNHYKERVRAGNTSDTVRVRAVFAIDRTLFNAEALDAKSLNSIGENLVREVTTIYFRRRRLLARLIMQPPRAPIEMVYERMRLQELTAKLDALTGGKFADKAWNWGDEEE